MILNVCYVSVGLFCTVFNGIYSKNFVVSRKNYENIFGPNHFTSEGKPIFGNKSSNRAVKIGKRLSEMFWNHSIVFIIINHIRKLFKKC